MTRPVVCPPAPGPLEGYAARFDDLFTRVAQRRGSGNTWPGLLAPRDRNKTLTALAGAEPATGAQLPAVQRLQFFLSESVWDPEAVKARRLELLRADADLAVQAREAGFAFRAVAADSAYGDQDGFRGELAQAGLPFVVALRPHRGTWARGPDAHTPVDAARELAWDGPDEPGDWHPVTRAFRDGHAETWFAADATLGWWGPDGARRLAVAAVDPGTLPDKATWQLVTNLSRPGGPQEADSPRAAASLAEVVRIYGLRNWVEQSYKGAALLE